MKFILQYISITEELSSLLNFPVIEGNNYSRTYLGQRLKWIMIFNDSAEFIERDAEMLKVALLTKHLKEVKQYNEDIFSQFKRSIKRCMKAADFYGLRMEINTAASLARANIKFTKTESPDFELTVNNENAFIECNSTHFSTDVGNPENKIIRAIRHKSKMPYANNNTALFIDVTNLLCKSDGSTQRPIKEIVQEELNEKNYGCILLFAYVFYDEGRSINSHYSRIDSRYISKNLYEFINQCFPFGKVELQTHWIPDQV